MNNLELLPQWFIVLYVVLLGLCTGSFLNVVILRGLKGEGIVFKRSYCPKCNNQLKWYMNIPLLSYLFLGGKCAFCKDKISIQYPFVEFITATAFLFIYFSFGLTLKTLFLCIIFALFIAMCVTDFKETVIIDIHAYILLGVGLLYSYLKLGDINIVQALIGAGFGFLIFEVLARLGKIFCGCRMFGEGDSLIALGLGAIFGWKNLLIIIALSILIQGLCAIPILIVQSFKNKNKKLAFSYMFVFFAIILLFIFNQIELINNYLLYSASTTVLTVFMLWSLKNILAEIRNKKLDDSKCEEEKFNLMPFGPALLISATICIFFINEIKECALSFFI
ncbi:MAG: prepilin peptidase [Candidatus Gastranaerophilales bacterium]|nr:prepilin peptidase [Candidatus Gastranaerophilales bacterium]